MTTALVTAPAEADMRTLARCMRETRVESGSTTNDGPPTRTVTKSAALPVG